MARTAVVRLRGLPLLVRQLRAFLRHRYAPYPRMFWSGEEVGCGACAVDLDEQDGEGVPTFLRVSEGFVVVAGICVVWICAFAG